MKKIKIKFINFWSDFDENDNFITNILKEKYDVEISDNPDYVITTPGGVKFEYANYTNAIRILLSGEPFSADYNSFDYVIDFDDYEFKDRHLRYPIYLYSRGLKKGPYIPRKKFNKKEATELLKNKDVFCNFIYGHKTVNGKREEILETVNSYKSVLSAGKYLNNTNGKLLISNSKEKIEIVKRSKFTIACESMVQDGFTTEKLTDAFCGYSIPIYCGNSNVKKDFNGKAFINVNDFKSNDDLLNYIKELDINNELYINKLMEIEFVSKDYCDIKYNELREFLFNIVDQDKEYAFRRNRYYMASDYNRIYILINKLFKSKVAHIIQKTIK